MQKFFLLLYNSWNSNLLFCGNKLVNSPGKNGLLCFRKRYCIRKTGNNNRFFNQNRRLQGFVRVFRGLQAFENHPFLDSWATRYRQNHPKESRTPTALFNRIENASVPDSGGNKSAKLFLVLFSIWFCLDFLCLYFFGSSPIHRAPVPKIIPPQMGPLTVFGKYAIHFNHFNVNFLKIGNISLKIFFWRGLQVFWKK